MSETGDRDTATDASSEPAIAIGEPRIDRRDAMRAVLGGAAGAAVWAAPRVNGFSVAPDYAAAGTVCSGEVDSVTVTSGSGAQIGCCAQTLRSLCYVGSANMNCGFLGAPPSNTNCGADATGTLSIPKNNDGPTEFISVAYTVGGGTKEHCASYTNDSRVQLNAINGIDSGVHSCTVNVNGTCTVGTFFMSSGDEGATNETNFPGVGNANPYWNNTPVMGGITVSASDNGTNLIGRRKVHCDDYRNSPTNASSSITITLTCDC